MSSLQKAETVEAGGLNTTQAAPDTDNGEGMGTLAAAAARAIAGDAALQTFSGSNERPMKHADSTLEIRQAISHSGRIH